MRRIELIWPDGSVTTGSSWPEVEAMIRAEQWRTYPTRRAFRRALRKRAKVWSGRRPGLRVGSERFLRSLADAEMFRIEITEDETRLR